MAINAGFSMVKGFLPDLGRALAKKRKNLGTIAMCFAVIVAS
jgi:hypothetical protein